MAEQAVAQIIPNMAGQEAAVAGSQAVVFTATDRKVIEERGGKIDKARSFLDAMKEGHLTPKVENEETNVKPEIDLGELKGRQKTHKSMLKHSSLYNPREKVEINNELPDKFEEAKPMPEPSVQTSPAEIKVEQRPIVVESEAKDTVAAYDKLAEEQESLSAVKSRVKEYHLKRLLTDNEKEFNELSEKIRIQSTAAVKPAGRAWLEAQLKKITIGTAQYKLKLLTALEEMHLDEQHKITIEWLKKTIESLATA